ncbi:hypothetical protein AB0A70_10360 [Streptomyces morookaense]
MSARGWQQEAALRMLQKNLDPEVAEPKPTRSRRTTAQCPILLRSGS